MSDAELAARHLDEVKQALADERQKVARLSLQVVKLRSRCRRLVGTIDALREMLAEVWSVEGVSQGRDRVKTVYNKGVN